MDDALLNKNAMSNASKAQVAELGTPISADTYKELRKYADTHKIKLSGFRNFVGNIEIIKTIIDDISEISCDFPGIIDEKSGICLELDFDMKDEDFATTGSGHIVHLNALYFCNFDRLTETYDMAVKEGNFVAGTNWRAIARHEAGHVAANFYHIDALEIIKEIMGIQSVAEIFNHLRKELSVYSAAYSDGREIISESFSGYYGKVDNEIANAFVSKCLEIRKER